MAEGEDWLFRPWILGKCEYKDLKHAGIYDLYDIAIMNEAIDVQMENQHRAQEVARKK